MDDLPISSGSKGELEHDFNTRIPSELLLAIFTLTLPNDDDDYESFFPFTTSLRISLVCTRWRKISLSLSQLWTHIHIHWPLELAQLYLHRAGPIAHLSFYLKDDKIRGMAEPEDELDICDYIFESDDDSERSESDSEISAIIDDEEIRELRSEAAGLGQHDLAYEGQGYHDSDNGSDDSGDDSDSNEGAYREERPYNRSNALLHSYQRNTPVAFFYDRKILARIRSVRFDRGSNKRSTSFAETYMYGGVQEIIHSYVLCSLESYTYVRFKANDLVPRAKRLQCPHLRHLSLSHSAPVFSYSWFPPTLLFLELYSTRFVAYSDPQDSGRSLDWLYGVLSRLPNLVELVLVNLDVDESITPADGGTTTDLLHLRKLTIELECREVKELFRLINLPSTVKIHCTLKFSQFGGTEGAYITDLVDQTSHILSLVAKPFKSSAHPFQTLRIDATREDGGYSITLSDPSDANALPPNLIIDFTMTSLHGFAPDPFPGSTAFAIQTAMGLPCHSVTRLVVKSPDTSVLSESHSNQCLDKLVEQLTDLRAVEILELPRFDLFNILMRADDRTIQLLSNYSLVGPDQDEQKFVKQLGPVYKNLARVNVAKAPGNLS